MPEPYYQDESVTIYHGDCREMLPDLVADAVISDPPYGMKWDGRIQRGPNGTGARGPTKHYGQEIQGDQEPFDPTPWLSFDRCILWGFHHFASRLPKGTVLVWLKRYDTGFGSFLSDADLAWMKGGEGVYCMRDVSLQGEQRLHPTQKPLPLLRWCVGLASAEGDVILDPFMGSGTTLRAAKDLGRRAIGVEIEERYCEIAAKRMGQEVFAL